MPTDLSNQPGDLTALDAVVTLAQTSPQMQPGDLGAAFAKMLITLVVIVFLLFATYWILRRVMQNRLQRGVGKGSIHILEKKMISPKTMLYLVEVEEKKILIAESHLEIKRLESFEDKTPTS